MESSYLKPRDDGTPKILGSSALFIGLIITLTLIFAVCCTAVFFLLRDRPRNDLRDSSTSHPQHSTHGSVTSFDSTTPIKDKNATRTSASSHPRETSTSTLSRLAGIFRVNLPSFGTRTTRWRRAATEDDDAWVGRDGSAGLDTELGMRPARRPRPVVVHDGRQHASEHVEPTYDVVQYPTLYVADAWNVPPPPRRHSISSLSETSTVIAAPLSPPATRREVPAIGPGHHSPVEDVRVVGKASLVGPHERRSQFTEGI